MVRARACIKCREYIVIHPENPINQATIKQFERHHTAHTIVTVDINEIRGTYSSFSNNGKVKPIGETN
ncbi:MAG: hypothetical protein ACXADU_19540 [Promethearchaeota archaeon]|jgi:hypothetical protein